MQSIVTRASVEAAKEKQSGHRCEALLNALTMIGPPYRQIYPVSSRIIAD
ncbi:MAG: hypothetical protein ACFBSF_01685 [Leptolyngbyaceae cyanobacterium]